MPGRPRYGRVRARLGRTPGTDRFRSPGPLLTLASPILLFAASVVGALGIALALPRRRVSPQLLGALIAGLGLGGAFLALGLRSDHLPNILFYVFSVIALGSALRMISHPRPVYAALYFILTILSSAGLYVLLSAEFMAFALVIVYAGAILITYLFVIMLATESPTADQIEALAEYDRYSREPIMATVTGFVLLAGLSTMLGVGASRLSPPMPSTDGSRLASLPVKVEKALISSGAMDGASEHIARNDAGYAIAAANGQISAVTVEYGQGQRRIITPADPRWPRDLTLTNVEGVGFTLLADHPGSIEVAGVVLLMAMVGAVVLARKKVELDDQAKMAAQSRALIDEASERALRSSPRVEPDPMAVAVHPGVNGDASAGVGGNGHGRGAGATMLSGGGGR